jgi:hypothetical protein
MFSALQDKAKAFANDVTGAVKEALANHSIGPMLLFRGWDPATHEWRVDCIVITNNESVAKSDLSLTAEGTTKAVPPTVYGQYKVYKFVTYNVTLPRKAKEAGGYAATYAIGGDKSLAGTFTVPHEGELVETLWYSCNDAQTEESFKQLADYDNTWRKVNETHKERPIHVAYSGGDFVYCDSVLCLPAFQRWNAIESDEKFKIAPTAEELEQIRDEYFRVYVKRMTNPPFAQALRSMPTGAVPDDHDFYDGKGSHSDQYNTSKFYTAADEIANDFRCLFTLGFKYTPGGPLPTGVYGVASTSIVHAVSPALSVVCFDHRTERRLSEANKANSVMITPASYEKVFAAMDTLPKTCRHVVVGLATPIAYGHNHTFIDLLEDISDNAVVMSLLQSVKPLRSTFKSAQNTIELLDDFRDSFDSEFFQAERNRFLTRLQKFAATRRIRLSYVGGDVHIAGFGEITSKEKKRSGAKDPLYGRQWITSPIANVPPSDLVAKMQGLNKFKPVAVSDYTEAVVVGETTTGKEVPGVLLAKRNFLRVRQGPKELRALLYVERDFKEKGSQFDIYEDTTAEPADDGGCCSAM